MKKFLIPTAFAAALIAACTQSGNTSVGVNNTAPASTPIVANANIHLDDGHDAPRISLADAKKEFDAKTAVFIDTHSKEQFEVEHIAGAINIPGNTIKQNMDKVPKGNKIIAYCS